MEEENYSETIMVMSGRSRPHTSWGGRTEQYMKEGTGGRVRVSGRNRQSVQERTLEAYLPRPPSPLQLGST